MEPTRWRTFYWPVVIHLTMYRWGEIWLNNNSFLADKYVAKPFTYSQISVYILTNPIISKFFHCVSCPTSFIIKNYQKKIFELTLQIIIKLIIEYNTPDELYRLRLENSLHHFYNLTSTPHGFENLCSLIIWSKCFKFSAFLPKTFIPLLKFTHD